MPPKRHKASQVPKGQKKALKREPMTKQDFMTALKKVTRKVKPSTPDEASRRT